MCIRDSHVAYLGDRGVGEYLLELEPDRRLRGGQEGGERAYPCDRDEERLDQRRVREQGEVEDRAYARDEDHPSVDHGRSVNQGRDRSGARHGVGKPLD